MNIHVVYQYHARSKWRYIEMALAEAAKSNCTNKHGAVIVKGGRVLSRAHNVQRNSPMVLGPQHVLTGATFHAENRAIRAATDLEGSTIFVTRLGVDGGPRLSRPCLRCYNEIFESGITEIFHT